MIAFNYIIQPTIIVYAGSSVYGIEINGRLFGKTDGYDGKEIFLGPNEKIEQLQFLHECKSNILIYIL